jgi:FkbM family methyltransferase
MVDVGAHRGGSLRSFALDGWEVYAVEPDPRNRAILIRRVRGMENVRVDGRAVSLEDGGLATLYTSPVSSGISSLRPFHPSHVPAIQVATVRLATLLAGVSRVTFLKTDTEGWDLRVLESFPWARLTPAAVLAEFEDKKTVPLGYDYHELAGFLVSHGYAVYTSEWYPVVEYGRRHRWRSVQPYPVELSHPEAWGNVIAVVPDLQRRLEAEIRSRQSARAT